MKCGSNKFCVGFEPDNKVYCYGDNNGCKWNSNDCNTDQDCIDKYTTSSPKFTDGDRPSCSNITSTNWRTPDACPNPYSIKCGRNKFCVGFESNHEVYCYGDNNGCKWNSNDCNTDQDCEDKYTTASPKFTNGDQPSCTNITDTNPLSNWRTPDACPDPYPYFKECTSIIPTWTFKESFGNNWYTIKKDGFKINWSNLGIASNLNMSISFWLKITTISSEWRNILHLSNNDNNCCNDGDRIPGIWIPANATSLYISNSTTTNYNNVYITNSLPLNKEQFITITFNNQTQTIYVNATLFIQYTYPSTLTSVTSKATFYIGDPWYNTDQGILIKDFALYNCSLSQNYISLLYSSVQSTLCNYQLSALEKQCYQNNYPQDLSNMNINELQNHWSNIGCKEGRSNQCPSQQNSSGLYKYKGCFNDTSIRAIPNEQKNVSNIDECAYIAEKNNQNVFGVQFSGQCFTGSNIEEAYQYGPNFNSSQCPSMGGPWTNQVYVRSNNFESNVNTTLPELSSANFGTKENFSNILNNYDNNKTTTQFSFMILLLIIILFIIYYFFRK